MNILTLIDVFSFNPAGGAGTVMFEVSKELKKLGHNIDIICRRREDLSAEGEIEGIKFSTFAVSEATQISQYYSIKKSFIHLIKKGLSNKKYDAVITHHSLPLYFVRNILKKAKIPIIYYYHSPWHLEHSTRKTGRYGLLARLTGRKRKSIEKKGIDAVDRIITLSEYMKNILIKEHSVDNDKINVIPGGYNIERFKPLNNRNEIREGFGFTQDDFVLLTVRSLIPRVGIENLISGISKIKEEILRVKLVIGGQGPLKESLIELSKSLGVGDKVSFPGFIPGKDLPKYYGMADLVVMPSLELEGFGLVTVEAMGCGTPVIATPVGGNIEILRDFNKELLFEDITVNGIAKGLLNFYAKYNQDLSLRAEVLKYVRENFVWEKAAHKVEKEIKELKFHEGR